MMCLPKEEMNAKYFLFKKWLILANYSRVAKKTNNKTAVFLCYCSRLSNNVVVIIANLNMQSY